MRFENPLLLIVGAFVIFVIGAAVGGMYTKIQYLEGQALGGNTVQAPAGNGQQAGAPKAPAAPTKVNIKVTADDPFLGDPNAKLTVVEFGDFQCPFCGKFHNEVVSELKKDYIDTGKIKFVFKNLAFLGKESTDTANAALCAKEQNKYWEYHDKIYISQSGENQGTFSIDNLKKFALDLGIEPTQFNDCLDAQKYNAQVTADNAEANKNGFNSTPSTAVGDTPVVGAQPYSAFKTIIDQKLAAL